MEKTQYGFWSLLIMLLLPVVVSAQTFTGLYRVASEADLESDATYILCADLGAKGFVGFTTEEQADADGYVRAISGGIVKQVEELRQTKDLFKIVLVGNKWHVYSVKHQAYLGMDTTSNFEQTPLLSLVPTRSSRLSIEKVGKDIQLKFGESKYLLYRENIETFSFLKSVGTAKAVQLYRMGEVREVELGEAGVKGAMYETVMLHLNHEFTDNVYNTFCAPFEIADYNRAFGENVAAYQLIKVADTSLQFSKMPRHALLKRNTPYLLWGVFDKSPYQIGITRIEYDGKPISWDVHENISLSYCYVGTDLSGADDSMVLFQNAWVSCRNQKQLFVRPFRWYIQIRGKNLKQMIPALKLKID